MSVNFIDGGWCPYPRETAGTESPLDLSPSWHVNWDGAYVDVTVPSRPKESAPGLVQFLGRPTTIRHYVCTKCGGLFVPREARDET